MDTVRIGALLRMLGLLADWLRAPVSRAMTTNCTGAARSRAALQPTAGDQLTENVNAESLLLLLRITEDFLGCALVQKVRRGGLSGTSAGGVGHAARALRRTRHWNGWCACSRPPIRSAAVVSAAVAAAGGLRSSSDPRSASNNPRRRWR
jgi:hypothetical protein